MYKHGSSSDIYLQLVPNNTCFYGEQISSGFSNRRQDCEKNHWANQWWLHDLQLMPCQIKLYIMVVKLNNTRHPEGHSGRYWMKVFCVSVDKILYSCFSLWCFILSIKVSGNLLLISLVLLKTLLLAWRRGFGLVDIFCSFSFVEDFDWSFLFN